MVIPLILLATNLTAFFLYGADKRRAKKNAWRISERTLLGVATCFGALGALFGMRAFRHKTKKKRFAIGVPLLLVAQLSALAWMYVNGYWL